MAEIVKDPFATRELLVQQVSWEARDVVSVRLTDPAGQELPPWAPGAHLEIVLPSGLTRQYSLCGRPADRSSYTVAVLREPNGRGGSREIHDTALVGRQLEVRGPRNHFALKPADSYLLIAGGIGVTPILAMARDLQERGIPWRLIYGGRSRESMAFLGQLGSLSPEIDVVPQDERGLLDLADALERLEVGTAVYACGPAGLLDAVTRECESRGVELHLERFGAAPPSEDLGDAEPATAFEVELKLTGLVLPIPSDRSILDVVRDVLPDAPSSCEEGFCGSCETRVLAGIPEHHDSILDLDERAANDTMMICVGRAVSSRLVLDL